MDLMLRLTGIGLEAVSALVSGHQSPVTMAALLHLKPAVLELADCPALELGTRELVARRRIDRSATEGPTD